ncbi:MFS transporter [Actinomadura napierensis]|uniref:MFS transporter n=1 Tax=Actinomadura napierensis TaxID=267854 RepID=A0ABN2Y0G6_9ACTN
MRAAPTVPRHLAGAIALARQNPVWRRYFAARWVSVTGSTVAPIAAAYAVLGIGGGATGIGLVLVGGPIVFMALSPVGGVVADRYPRRTVLACCQYASAAVQGAVAVLVLTGSASVPALAGLQLVQGAVTAFFGPAARGLLPQLVDKEALPDANGLAQISNNMVAIGGPPVAGVVIAFSGPGWVLAWDAVSFLLSGLLFGGLAVPPVRPRPAARFRAEIAEGWRVLAGLRWVAAIAVLSATSSGLWAASITVLGPVWAADRYDGAVTWGLFSSALGAGLAAGSITAVLVRPQRPGLICCLVMLPEAALLGAMAAGLPFPLVAAAAVVCGAGGTLELVVYQSALGAWLPEEHISRVQSFIALIGTVLVPVAMVGAGPAAALLGAPVVLGGCAAVALLAAAVAYSVPDVRALRATPEPVPVPATSDRAAG